MCKDAGGQNVAGRLNGLSHSVKMVDDIDGVLALALALA